MRASILSPRLSLLRAATVVGLALASAGPAFAQSEDDFDLFEDEEEDDSDDGADDGARPEDEEKPVDDFDPDDDE